MYRTYENPHTIEVLLEKAKSYANEHPDDIDAVIEVHELKERLNFAWQDDEAEIECYEF